MSEFNGKTILITGAARSLGRQLALDFAHDGANVCVNYSQSATAARQVVAEIESAGGRAIAYQADVSEAAQVGAMVESAIGTFGAIDVLVNNAGISIDGPFIDITEADWDRVQAVNLKGPFLVSQAVARHMIEGNGGVIVNISANSSFYGRPDATNYSSSKAGLNMLTKCMALELGPKVRVNGIGLGFVDSDLVREVFSKQQIEEVLETTPLRRMTSYEDTATFVKMLASESSSFMTGQTIVFDGGRILR